MASSTWIFQHLALGDGRGSRQQTWGRRAFLSPLRPSGLGRLAGNQCQVAIGREAHSSSGVDVNVDAGASDVGWIPAMQLASGPCSDTVLPEVRGWGPGGPELGRGGSKPERVGVRPVHRVVLSSGRGALCP